MRKPDESGEEAQRRREREDREDEAQLASTMPIAATGLLPVSGVLGATPGGPVGTAGSGAGALIGGAALYGLVDDAAGAAESAAGGSTIHGDEGEVAARVEAALAEDGRIGPATLSTLAVAADRHAVTVDGTAVDEAERRRIGSIAEHAASGATVHNRVVVAAGQQRPEAL